jgi:Tfp pilus assembly protein PilF
MVHFYLAMVYQQTSRNGEALVEFKEALRRDPKNFPANVLLGRMYVSRELSAAERIQRNGGSRLRTPWDGNPEDER